MYSIKFAILIIFKCTSQRIKNIHNIVHNHYTFAELFHHSKQIVPIKQLPSSPIPDSTLSYKFDYSRNLIDMESYNISPFVLAYLI